MNKKDENKTDENKIQVDKEMEKKIDDPPNENSKVIIELLTKQNTFLVEEIKAMKSLITNQQVQNSFKAREKKFIERDDLFVKHFNQINTHITNLEKSVRLLHRKKNDTNSENGKNRKVIAPNESPDKDEECKDRETDKPDANDKTSKRETPAPIPPNLPGPMAPLFPFPPPLIPNPQYSNKTTHQKKTEKPNYRQFNQRNYNKHKPRNPGRNFHGRTSRRRDINPVLDKIGE